MWERVGKRVQVRQGQGQERVLFATLYDVIQSETVNMR